MRIPKESHPLPGPLYLQEQKEKLEDGKQGLLTNGLREKLGVLENGMYYQSVVEARTGNVRQRTGYIIVWKETL